MDTKSWELLLTFTNTHDSATTCNSAVFAIGELKYRCQFIIVTTVCVLCTQTRVSTAFKISDMYKISCTAVLSHAQNMHGTVLYKYQCFRTCVHSTAKEYPIQDRLINQTDADQFAYYAGCQ